MEQTKHWQISNRLIIVKRKQLKSVLQSKTYPGADITTDHNLLSMKFRLQGRKQKRIVKKKQRFDICKLKQSETLNLYQRKVKELINDIAEDEIPTNIEENWRLMNNSILKAANETIGMTKNPPRKPWITEKIIELIEERRKYKNLEDIEGRISISI